MTTAGVKTAELQGAALDWAVGMASHLPGLHTKPKPGKVCVYAELPGYDVPYPFQPSTDWSQGGPLIEQERIGVWPSSSGYFAEKKHFRRHHKAGRNYGEGPTPLIAAMRCLCHAKLGDTVQIPKELMQ